MPMTCVGFKRLERGSLLGFADLQMDSGLVLLGCTFHHSNGKRWVNPPGRPQLDADKKPVDSVTSNIGHLLGTGLLDDRQSALVAAGLVLFVLTLGVNAVASTIVSRSRSGAATEI